LLPTILIFLSFEYAIQYFMMWNVEYFIVFKSVLFVQVKHLPDSGCNRLSAEARLGGDNRLGRLNMWGGAAWLSGLVACLELLPEYVC
jgi:hypothetical protein